jgi:hypothetical protein
VEDKQLGRLQKVDLRDYWQSEAGDFTPWLAQAENIELLGEAIGIELEVEAQEKNVGPFRADILCKDTADDHWVLVENQLERTDHTHLGQLLTYAAGLNAVTIVWVSAQFTEEHRAALDWPNDITDDRFNFFGLEVELWRIGDSLAAPKFNVVSKPNDWTRSVSGAARSISESPTTDTQQLQLDFWTGLLDHVRDRDFPLKTPKAYPQSWMWMGIGRTGFGLSGNVSTWSFEKGQYGQGEVRAELTIQHEDCIAFFELLRADISAIEAQFGEKLNWYSKEGVKTCRIYVIREADIQDRSVWPELYEWLRAKLAALRGVFRERVKALDAKDWRTEEEQEAL